MTSHSPGQRPLHPVVVAPTYNNAAMVGEVLSAVADLQLPIIAVNDGSTDQTTSVVEQLTQPRPHEEIRLLHHDRNRGKAAALQTGFARAAELGYTHAVTIDTDRQHEPADIPALLAAAERHPTALILGTRQDDGDERPMRSQIGRRISDAGVGRLTGRALTDSQCGLRCYPLALIDRVRCATGGYAFESEIVIRAARAGWPIEEVPITGTYLTDDQRISHFQPVMDSLRWGWMFLRVLTARP